MARVVMTWSLTTSEIRRTDGGVGAPGARTERTRRGTAGASGSRGPPGCGRPCAVSGLAMASRGGDGPVRGGGDQAEAGQDEAAGDGPAEVGAGEASPGDVSPTVVGVDEAGLPGGPSGAKVGLVGTG